MSPRLWEGLREGGRGGSACHNVSNDGYTTAGGRPGEGDFPFTNCCLEVDWSSQSSCECSVTEREPMKVIVVNVQ